MPEHLCRGCGSSRLELFLDLGQPPISSAYARGSSGPAVVDERPIRARFCLDCALVQLDRVVEPEEVFSGFTFLSSTSESWLAHGRRFVETVVPRFALGSDTLVLEIASNDGYLLRSFRDAGTPVLGVEPATDAVTAARATGIETRAAFFDRDLAIQLQEEGVRPRLIVANNVLQHVPDLDGFVGGIRRLLPPNGIATIEFPHLLGLLEGGRFDTLYHESYSYFGLMNLTTLLARHGLTAFDVESLSTHGGSLRVYLQPVAGPEPITDRVTAQLRLEREHGLDRVETYHAFARRVAEARDRIRAFLEEARRSGKRVVGYGAPAKANVLIRHCGIDASLLEFTVDQNPHKQGCSLPGTQIPIREPAAIDDARPDYLLVLPWNLREEIVEQMAHVREWGCRFVLPIPELEIIP